VSRHQGIWSLGLLLTIGASASLAAALVLLPVLIRFLAREVTWGASRVSSAGT